MLTTALRYQSARSSIPTDDAPYSQPSPRAHRRRDVGAQVPGIFGRAADLLVVGTPNVDVVYDVAEKASAQFGREVNPTVLTRHEWEASSEGFLEQLRRSPLVSLDLSHSHNVTAVDAK